MLGMVADRYADINCFQEQVKAKPCLVAASVG